MISLKIILDAIAGFIVLASTNGYAAQLQTGGEVVAREASEDPRGPDRVHTGTHKNSAAVDSIVIAREAAEDPRGADNNNQGRRGRA